MRSEPILRRKLVFLTFRGHEAIAEVEHITSSFLWDLVVVSDLEQLGRQLRCGEVRVVLVDLRDAMPFFLDSLPVVARANPGMQWVGLVEGHATQNPTNAAFLYSYFFDFCLAPIEPLRLSFSVGHAWAMAKVADAHLSNLESEVQRTDLHHGLIGASKAMKAIRTQLKRYADNDLPVLITGDTGTGKEKAARFLHGHSARGDGPFVAVNCGALTPSLVQSELFGHEKGAFTGATKRKIGRIESANGGTLLLDEVGDLPPDTQVSLLRFLQEGVIERVGGVDSIPVDVRVVAATHVDLEEAVRRGTFREDLYFRLNVLRVHMPTLAERDQDVVELAQYYVAQFSAELKTGRKTLCPASLAALRAHCWPGNIRELMNRLRRAIVLCERSVISPADLEFAQVETTCDLPTLADAREIAERNAISRALVRSGNNVSEAARLLDVSRVTLHRLIRRHHLYPS